MITMETMKGSRRKQTKPIRVPFGVDPDTGAFNATMSAAHQQQQQQQQEHHDLPPPPSDTVSQGVGPGGDEEDMPMPHSLHNGETEMEEGGDAPLDMHVSIISCRMCPETFPTNADLRDHVEVVHGSQPAKRSRMDAEFPTAYHRLGSELYQEHSSLMPNGHSEGGSQSQALSLTNKPKPQQPDHRDFEDAFPLHGGQAQSQATNGGEGTSHKVNGGKIFHPDAYCELCDREFCNKYFLKTHRANKHGIYDSSSPPTSLPGDAPPHPFEINLPSSSSGSTPHSQKVELSPSPWQQQQQSKKDGRPDSQQNSQKKLEAELDTQKKVSSVITAVMNSMSSSGSETKTSSTSNNSTSGGSGSSGTAKDPSMEDYCEFCQKHFCNKYYLKKHKQDVHGIIPETGPTTTKRSRPSSSLLDFPSTSVGSHMLLPQPMASLGGMPALPPGVMVLNPFMPQMTIIPTGGMPQPLLHAHQLHHHSQSPIMSQSLPMPGSLPGISPNTPTSSSHSSSRLSPNPDTFCNLCRKEFSNAYFLKIHKANRHGIQSEEIPPEAKMLGDMVESNGIIVPPRPSSKDFKQEGGDRERGGERRDSYGYGGSRSSPPPLTSINHTVTCRQCDKDFPNAQAFKIHQITEHGRNLEASLPDSYESSLPKSEFPPISSSESLRRMSADAAAAAAAHERNGGDGRGGERGSSGGGGTGQTMFGNIVAAKLADRVVCDICNKDLCNKYFLKSHKLKMHGVDTDKEDGRVSTSSGDKSAQHSPLPPNSMTPNNKPISSQPLNMSMGSPKAPPPPPPPPPALVMPKLEMRDFQDYSRDYKMMEKFGAFKKFTTDVPTFLSETINNEYMMRQSSHHGGPSPFKGLDFGMQGMVPGGGANLSHDQLVEEGIDPEAYCDICKKEFCSKYFLRTHKQNIHGIKMETPSPDRSRAKPGPKPALSKIGANGNPLMGLPMPGMPFNFPPGLMMGGSNGGGPFGFGMGGMGGMGGGGGERGGGDRGSGGGGGGGMNRSSRDSFEKSQFRWKDPSNSQRVTCDICNKEVCNKYFLRTHKLKKHGIAPSETSLSPMSGSPVPSENDASSNHSSQPDNFLLDKGMFPRSDGMSVPQSIPLPPSERSAKANAGGEQKISSSSIGRSEEEKAYLASKQRHSNNHHLNNNNNNTKEAINCHLCDREFRNMQWLSAHLMKDHAEACSPELMDLRMLPPPLGPSPHFGAELEPKVCQVCRIHFPNEIFLQLHLLQEHNAQIRLQVDDASAATPRSNKIRSLFSSGSSRTVGLKAVKPWRSAGKKHGLTALRKQQKMYVCLACNYQSHWLSKLQEHEESAHGLVTGSERKQGVVENDAHTPVSATEKESSASLALKQFKCGLCTSRFATHAYCQMHLREAHIHMLKDFVSRKRDCSGRKRLSCSLCTFSTSFPFRLHSHATRFHHHQHLRNHHRRPHSNGQRKSSFQPAPTPTDTTPTTEDAVAGSNTPPESADGSINNSPLPGSIEAPSFERPPAVLLAGPEDEEEEEDDLGKETFQIGGGVSGGGSAGEDEEEDMESASAAASVTLADNFMSGMPVHQPVSTSFRMTEVTP